MSQTASQGFVEASRWTGVASSMHDYLTEWLAETGETPPAPPIGTLAASERFFRHVLFGIAPSRQDVGNVPSPSIAGVSNFSIALDVLAAMPTSGTTTIKNIESKFVAYLKCVQMIRRRAQRTEVSKETVEDLAQFFLELCRQGDLRRYSAFAR